ncbi:MAG: PAS domain-containing sensor histidine kinase, partial [Muribaculaceae bacterium]|nr:PAS domain-containing sensor histidine kinase [Muribaculaceae bacterium]
MRIRTAFLLITIFVAALIVQMFLTAGVSLWWKAGMAAALGICLLTLYLSVVRPMATLANGIDLLRGQDFGSRLAPVGHKDADRLVEMFNTMMQ